MGARSTQVLGQVLPGENYIGGILTLTGANQQLTTTSHPVLSVIIKNTNPNSPTTTNSAVIILEPFGLNPSVALQANESLVIDINNPNKIRLRGTNGNVIGWIGLTQS